VVLTEYSKSLLLLTLIRFLAVIKWKLFKGEKKNKMAKYVLCMTFFCFAIAANMAHAQTAEEMVSYCKPVSEASIQDDVVNFPRTFETGECWGAFGTLQDAVRATLSEGKNATPTLLVCAPPESTRTQFVAIFMEYAKKNPQRLHESFFFVAFSALHEAFPCKSKWKN